MRLTTLPAITLLAIAFSIIGFNAGSSSSAEQSATFKPLWPQGTYSSEIPTAVSVLGYDIGDRITTHSDMIKYFEALQEVRPDQVKIFDYGYTHEHRRLIYVALSSAENIAKLDDISAATRSLSNPGGISDDEAAAIINKLPASLWLAYSVHGNEISPTDAAMATAHHLLASTNDPRVPKILKNTVIFINPLQNPDGRDRFIHRYRTAKGISDNPDRISAEHNEPWPSGRTNHYLFDLNRDWITTTQPETQGHVKVLQQHYPQVFIDFHEMGSDKTYYFAPEAIPYNPHLTKNQRTSLFWFGRKNAKWFDHYGLPYFTRDVYDAFYPGYGASWPAYYGALSMTYEQASSRGLSYRRSDGSEFTFRETIFGHFVTSLAAAEVTAEHSKEILQNFYIYQKTAIKEGREAKGEARSYIFPKTAMDANTRKLLLLLQNQGVDIKAAGEDQSVCGINLSAGDGVIDAAQPRARLIRTLLNPQVDMNPDWLKEQERRRAKHYDHDIYDVTAWALPQMFNVSMTPCSTLPKNLVNFDFNLIDDQRSPLPEQNKNIKPVVYLVDGLSGAIDKLIARSLTAGLKVKIHTDGFVLEGKSYQRGTLIYKADDLGRAPDILRAATKDLGVTLVPHTSTFVDSGRSLGGRSVIDLVAPRIAMAWDEGTSSSSAGNSRFVIEHQIGYPVTVIRTQNLAQADLGRYDVLVLPEGSYDAYLGKAENIKDWVQKGGVLVGQGSALRYLISDKVKLLSAQPEAKITPGPKKQPETVQLSEASSPYIRGVLIDSTEALNALTIPDFEGPDSVPGALVNAVSDQDHWLTAGVKPDLVVLAKGSDIYAPLKLDTGQNVVHFTGAENILSSGYLWQENQQQMAYKPFVMIETVGRGMVIGFTYDPTIRAYLDGLRTLYSNTLLVAPSVARKIR